MAATMKRQRPENYTHWSCNSQTIMPTISNNLQMLPAWWPHLSCCSSVCQSQSSCIWNSTLMTAKRYLYAHIHKVLSARVAVAPVGGKNYFQGCHGDEDIKGSFTQTPSLLPELKDRQRQAGDRQTDRLGCLQSGKWHHEGCLTDRATAG